MANQPDTNLAPWVEEQPTLKGRAGRESNSARRARQEDQSVAKANEAIAIRPRRGKLTLLSRRIYNVLLFHAQQQGVEAASFTILLSELIDDARFNSNNTKLLKSHLVDMQSTTIEWSTSGGGRQAWQSTQLLGPVRIDDDSGRGRPVTITWTFPEPIKQRLLTPTQYTRILLEISSQMRSYAAAVLFELGQRYLTSPAKLTMREDVVWWASVLTGRSDITAVDYRILHRDTIKKALAELDGLALDFRMEVVEHRRGRKVEELQFRVVQKAQRELRGVGEGGKNVFDLELVERLVMLGFRRSDAQDLYAVTDEGVLRAALEHVEARLKNPSLPPLKSAVAYLKDAVRKSYAGSSSQASDEPPVKPSMEERLERLREEWRQAKVGDARRAFEELTDAMRADKLAKFESERVPDLPSPIGRAWRQDGIRSRIAGASFFRWLANDFWPGEVSDTELLTFALDRVS